jgi:hypothetical protein
MLDARRSTLDARRPKLDTRAPRPTPNALDGSAVTNFLGRVNKIGGRRAADTNSLLPFGYLQVSASHLTGQGQFRSWGISYL